MQRDALTDDVHLCPTCLSRKDLIIGWFSDIDCRSKEYTKVGCKKCEIYFTADESKHAIAQWNHYSATEHNKEGRIHRYAELHELLYLQSKCEIEAKNYQSEINSYLEKNISSKCKYHVGQLFIDESKGNTTWIVRDIYSVYGWNTGPFWMMEAEKVTRNGKFTEVINEFWERDQKFYKECSRYFTPTRWSSLKVGIKCSIIDKVGLVKTVDQKRRIAEVTVDNEVVKVSSLASIKLLIDDIN